MGRNLKYGSQTWLARGIYTWVERGAMRIKVSCPRKPCSIPSEGPRVNHSIWGPVC